MPAADVVLLPLCIGLTLLGVIVTVLAWRRSTSKGRVVQALGWTLAPVALYFSGLLTLVWNGVSALVAWAGRLVFSPPVWAGLSLLALCAVLIVVGGFVARRSAGRPAVTRSPSSTTSTPNKKPASNKALPAPAQRGAAAPKGKAPAAPVDEDMAEIEAILRNRGIN